MPKASFYSITQAQYDELVSTSQTIETALYFTSDTHKLFKGSNSYSGDEIIINFIGSEENFPESGIEKQIYTKPSTFESRIWKDNAWIELTLPIVNTINADNTHLQYPSAKAVYTAINGLSIPSIDGLEATSNKVTSITSESTDAQYPSAKAVYTIVSGLSIPSIDGLEATSNKATSITNESTDVQYPSAKAVKNFAQNETLTELTGSSVTVAPWTQTKYTADGICTITATGWALSGFQWSQIVITVLADATPAIAGTEEVSEDDALSEAGVYHAAFLNLDGKIYFHVSSFTPAEV